MSSGKSKKSIKKEIDEKLIRLATIITDGWKNGRVPLFLFGASGTPIDINPYDFARKAILNKYGKLEKYGGTMISFPVTPPLPRPIQSRFFSDLKKWDNGQLWSDFCTIFLEEWVKQHIELCNANHDDSIYKLITDNFVCKTARSGYFPDAVILTTNFDGAIPDYLMRSTESGSVTHCYVLEDSLRIRRLAQMGAVPRKGFPKLIQSPYIMTLRGDVYHALCQNPFCSMGGKAVTAYEALRVARREYFGAEAEKNNLECSEKNIKGIAKGILKCPECQGDRLLTISFPGIEIKEQEIIGLMTAVWATFGMRVSVICTIGFSGNSDREVVSYLLKFANAADCCWFDFGVDALPDLSATNSIAEIVGRLKNGTAVREYAGRRLKANRFEVVDGGGAKENLLSLTSKLLPSGKQQEVPLGISDQSVSEHLPDDRLWVSSPASSIDLGNVTMQRKMPIYLHTLLADISGAKSSLIRVGITSQLALKNYWWRPSVSHDYDMSIHSRLFHSVGVLRVADVWFRSIRNKQNYGSKNDEEALHCAALSHDIGHMPFSHLIEEVFRELNWSLDGSSAYSHEAVTHLGLKTILQDKADLYLRASKFIDGSSGKHWVDAILNSPFDADKIDYIFRDQRWIGLGGRTGQNHVWLSEFLSEQEVTPQGQIMLHGRSAVAAFKLLSERAYLYDMLYYAPKVRVMERMTRYILVKYFTLRIAPRITRAMIRGVASQNHKTIAEYWLDHDFVEAILGKGFSRKPDTMAMSFLSSIKQSHADGEGTSPLADIGAVKLAFSIAEVYRMVDMQFRLSRKYRTPNPPRTGDKDNDVTAYEYYLRQAHASKTEEDITERKIITEIGAWAVRESRHVKAKQRQNDYIELVKLCHLVLDPNYAEIGETLEESKNADGKWLDRVFLSQCIGGPYVVRAPLHIENMHETERWLDEKKRALEEIGRQLSCEHPGRFLLDVTGPLKVRTYPRERIIHTNDGVPHVCEQFWVPAGDPQSWSAASRATVPLSSIDFRKSLSQAYKLRVLLIDPTNKEDARDIVIDRFRMACKSFNIALEDEGINDYE